MDDKEFFREIVSRLNKHGIRMIETLVYLDYEPIFNTDGFNFEYNLYRLGELVKNAVDFS